jgi:hypothetical protein
MTERAPVTDPEYPLSSSSRELGGNGGVRLVNTVFGTVEVYSKDPNFVVAVVGRYLLHISLKEGSMTCVSQVRRAATDLSARYDKFGYVGLIDPGAQLLMPPDVRNGVNAFVKRFSPRFTAAAIVYEKTGFHATAVRSVVTAINFASRASHPNQVFSDLREGVAWVAKLTPGEPTTAGLTHIVGLLRKNPT